MLANLRTPQLLQRFQLYGARAGRDLDAELRQHVVEGLQGERGLGGLVTCTVETNDQTVTDQLVGPYAGDARDVLQTLGVDAERCGQQQGRRYQLLELDSCLSRYQKGNNGLRKNRSNQPGWLVSAKAPVPE